MRHFDCSFGGVGGHPAQVEYGGGYTGNVCTEDLVNLFESLGIHTGLDLAGLIETFAFASRRSAASCMDGSPAAGSIRCCGSRADRTSKRPWKIWAHPFWRRHTGTDRFR